jgi:hypothetical protein
MRLEQAIDRSLRHEVLSLVGEAHRQLAGRQLRLLQRQVEDPAPDLLGMRFQTRPGRDERSPRASGPPVWWRSYQR